MRPCINYYNYDFRRFIEKWMETHPNYIKDVIFLQVKNLLKHSKEVKITLGLCYEEDNELAFQDLKQFERGIVLSFKKEESEFGTYFIQAINMLRLKMEA